MKKTNKIWIPIVIVLGVLVVAIFAAGIIVKVTIGKHEVHKGSGEVKTVDYQQEETPETKNYDLDDISASADPQVTVVSALESPKGKILLNDSVYSDLTEEDLEGLTAEELFYALNEIYAYEGAHFDNETVQAYFDNKDWYYGFSGDDYTVEKVRESLEEDDEEPIHNIELIENYMKDNNLTFEP